MDLLYPGTSVNADGSIADVPGWILNPDGLWVRDPSDTFLRDGITLTYVQPDGDGDRHLPARIGNVRQP